MNEAIMGKITWGNGEPCPICKQPFEEPDLKHLLSHPEAKKLLFGQKGKNSCSKCGVELDEEH